MSESEIQQRIQIEAVRFNCQLMRNNSGAFKDQTGRFIFFGLGNISKKHGDQIKSSDLIGFTTVRITPDMVGKEIAVFTAVEVKDDYWKLNEKNPRELAQKAFIDWVKSKGGIAGFANSVLSFTTIIQGFFGKVKL